MKVSLYYHTLKHLKIEQLLYQAKNKLSIFNSKSKKKYQPLPADKQGKPLFLVPFIRKPDSYLGNNRFRFLNIEQDFAGWDDHLPGKLWNYNLNYMDYLIQNDTHVEYVIQWIDHFIDDADNKAISWEPYPIALRGINWIKCISVYYPFLSKEEKQRWDASLYSQYQWLYKNLEFHLLGNHLLEDAYSLFFAGLYFKDSKFYEKAVWLLVRELNEQILPDGAHYELSSMYHEILLDRLLDCINAAKYNLRFIGQENVIAFLEDKAIRMLSWLDTIIYKDGTIPLLNDAAYGIAPSSQELFAYAERLDLQWSTRPLKECGYRKFVSDHFEMILDIGNIGPDYIPGHAHADTFNYELRIDGNPFIIDSGISTYDKNERRQYERETHAHNTVYLDEKSSSDVWGGFRVGRRAKITYLKEGHQHITARHDGFRQYGLEHQRIFDLSETMILICDSLIPSLSQKGINSVILHPDVKIIKTERDMIQTNLATIRFYGIDEVWIDSCEVSFEYNKRLHTKKICFSFTDQMQYEITYNPIHLCK